MVCNSLQGRLICPPPIQICYKSVSVTLWVDRSKWVKQAAKSYFNSTCAAVGTVKGELNVICNQNEHYSTNTIIHKWQRNLFMVGFLVSSSFAWISKARRERTRQNDHNFGITWGPLQHVSTSCNQTVKVFTSIWSMQSKQWFLHYFVCSGVRGAVQVHW